MWRRSRVCAVFTFIIIVRHSRHMATLRMPGGVAALLCARGARCHHTCSPLPHQIATLGVRQGVAALPCMCGAHFQLPWLLLAALGCSGCSRLLLAASDCSWLVCMQLMVTVDLKKTSCLGSCVGIGRTLYVYLAGGERQMPIDGFRLRVPGAVDHGGLKQPRLDPPHDSMLPGISAMQTRHAKADMHNHDTIVACSSLIKF
jgi:hypothetical protein